jgi:hypothetical protein
MSNEFTITLPSNVFSKQDPKNTPSKYVTRLNRPIQLDGHWEVAATRLQLQNCWYNFTKPQLLGVYVRDIRTSGDTYDVGTRLRRGITEKTEPSEERQFNASANVWKNDSCFKDAEFVKNMSYRCITFPAGVYRSLDQMGSMLCQLIMDCFENTFEDLELAYKYIAPLESVQLYNDADESDAKLYVVRIVTCETSTDLNVMEVLGFGHAYLINTSGGKLYKFYGGSMIPTKEDVTGMDNLRLKQYCQINSKVVSKPSIPEVRQLMLYADIAALRHVGNIEAQLLDSVVVNAKFGDCEDVLRGVTPNYVPVYRNTFSSIEIELTDYTGEPLHFPSDTTSPVIVTLRFRKVKSDK